MSDLSAQATQLLSDVLAWQGLFALKLGKERAARDLLREGVSVLERSGLDVEAASGAVSCALLQMELVLTQVRTRGHPAAFLLADIDNFRRVNNTYGHSTGDLVLQDCWRLWWEGVPKGGSIFRWGGEELVMLLPDADASVAISCAEGMRQRIQDHVCEAVDGRQVRVTISIGVALYPKDADDLFSLHARADQAAVRAKAAGKNRVCVSGDVP
jgi:diguanylate cyclase (GGDEF)-like protein